MGFRASESISSSSRGKYLWGDYDDDDENCPGGICTLAFWRRRFCTRSALSNTLKHVATTLLGLLIIIAIALTALDKIRNRAQTSKSIPEGLEGTIMEAQVMVIKDTSNGGLRKSKDGIGSAVAEGDEESLDQSEAVKMINASKIPVWSDAIQRQCLQKKCDLDVLGKEYFAFLVSYVSF
jgi:hypothetical protein